MSDGLSGQLLVAAPQLRDPNFYRTVVLILQHTEEGALGVVLNRPTEVGLPEELAQWKGMLAPPGVVFAGGPVEAQTVICLGRKTSGGDLSGAKMICPGVAAVDLDMQPGSLSGISALRIFIGYAGWGKDQLESEIGSRDWFIFAPKADDVTTAEPGELWRRVLRRQGETMAMLAHFPPHPSLN